MAAFSLQLLDESASFALKVGKLNLFQAVKPLFKTAVQDNI